jgi:hypothetical protein
VSKIELDHKAADAITVHVLKDQRSLIKKEIKAHLKKGEYMHPEDLAFNQTTLLPALEVIIKYFGC